MRGLEVMAVARRGGPPPRFFWLVFFFGMSACGRVPLDAPVGPASGGLDAYPALGLGTDARATSDARMDAHLASDRPADAHATSDAPSDARPASDAREDTHLTTDTRADTPTTIDARADLRPAIDAGSDATAACSTDGGLRPWESVVSGEIDGPEIDGDVCAGGAGATLERTVYGKFLMLIENTTMGTPSGRFQFQTPANVTSAGLILLTEIDAPTPRTYTSGETCGSVTLCAYLPTPPVDCGDGGVNASCPPGCALAGPVLGPTCTPIEPYVCYVADAASDCLGYPQTAHGSWTLTLTSVDPYDNSSPSGTPFYVVHGALNANLIGGEMNGGNEPATLALTF
jgi:hypothetical protein